MSLRWALGCQKGETCRSCDWVCAWHVTGLSVWQEGLVAGMPSHRLEKSVRLAVQGQARGNLGASWSGRRFLCPSRPSLQMFTGGRGGGRDSADPGGQVGFGRAEGKGKAGSPGESIVSDSKGVRRRGPDGVGREGDIRCCWGQAERARGDHGRPGRGLRRDGTDASGELLPRGGTQD